MNLAKIVGFIKPYYIKDQTGHDLQHIQRVLANAESILAFEKVDGELAEDVIVTETVPLDLDLDLDLVKAIIWLHEAFDKKLAFNISEEDLRTVLIEAGASMEQIHNLLHSIKHLSYSDNLQSLHGLSLEGQIAQDADRLDAMGAIGIARCFHYGGSRGHALYNDKEDKVSPLNLSNYYQNRSSVQHFHDKLLKLKDLMNTPGGRQLAWHRHQFMEDFLRKLAQEIGVEEL